jgi:hypothetical protein
MYETSEVFFTVEDAFDTSPRSTRAAPPPETATTRADRLVAETLQNV